MTKITQRFGLMAALLACLALTGCMKSVTKMEIKADASATFEMSNSLSMAAMDMILMQVENAGEDADQVVEGLEEMQESMTAAAMRKSLEGMDIEVTEAKDINEDGWEGSSVKGKVKDINVMVTKMEKALAKSMEEDAEMIGELPFDLNKMIPRFYKTKTQGVGEMVIVPSFRKLFAELDQNPLDMLEEMDDADLEQAEAMLDMMKGMLQLDQMIMSMEVKLPGEIVSVTGGKMKKDEKQTFTFAMKGSEIGIDRIRSMMGLADGVSVRFKIPEGCKINFVERKQEAKKEEKKEEKKDGGLKIGGGR